MNKDADERFQTGREMFAALSEVRPQFDDDAVLTPVEPGSVQAATTDSDEEEDEMKTSAAWSPLQWQCTVIPATCKVVTMSAIWSGGISQRPLPG